MELYEMAKLRMDNLENYGHILARLVGEDVRMLQNEGMTNDEAVRYVAAILWQHAEEYSQAVNMDAKDILRIALHGAIRD